MLKVVFGSWFFFRVAVRALALKTLAGVGVSGPIGECSDGSPEGSGPGVNPGTFVWDIGTEDEAFTAGDNADALEPSKDTYGESLLTRFRMVIHRVSSVSSSSARVGDAVPSTRE